LLQVVMLASGGAELVSLGAVLANQRRVAVGSDLSLIS
jgi:hypothetical protein